MATSSCFHGVVPACRSLACVSLFAGTVADAWEALEVAAGYDAADAWSRRMPTGAMALPPSVRIGVPDAASLVLDGAIDFRGKEIDVLREPQIKEAASKIKAQGKSRVAVVGKFCQRNHSHELKAGEILASALPSLSRSPATAG